MLRGELGSLCMLASESTVPAQGLRLASSAGGIISTFLPGKTDIGFSEKSRFYTAVRANFFNQTDITYLFDDGFLLDIFTFNGNTMQAGMVNN